MVLFAEISSPQHGLLGRGGGTDPARIGEFEPSITFYGVCSGRNKGLAKKSPLHF